MSRTQLWSCGGGVQSAAIAALIVSGRLPRPDLAVIADTERERSSTWTYMDEVLSPALLSVGVNLVRVPKSHYEHVDLWQGEDESLLSIPAYINHRDGTQGRLMTRCSDRWKTRVIQRWARGQGVKHADVWIGISRDEMRRVRVSDKLWWRLHYPLIETVPLTRYGCQSVVRDIGWPEAPRSACWMCPQASNASWRQLRDTAPNDWLKAVALEQEIRVQDPRVTLHRSGRPLDEAPIDVEASEQGELFACSGGCWT